MAESRHLVALDFREPPMLMFPNEVQHRGANQLVFELTEPGSITADFQKKVPGATMELGPARMTFSYDQSFCADNQLEAYERLIHDAMIGDATAHQRRGRRAAVGDQRRFARAPARAASVREGSWGPKRAVALIAP